MPQNESISPNISHFVSVGSKLNFTLRAHIREVSSIRRIIALDREGISWTVSRGRVASTRSQVRTPVVRSHDKGIRREVASVNSASAHSNAEAIPRQRGLVSESNNASI